MTEIFEYKEVIMDMNKPFIDQLNEEGQNGWEFCTQAQKVDSTVDFRTGQNKITIITIYKRKTIKINGQA